MRTCLLTVFFLTSLWLPLRAQPKVVQDPSSTPERVLYTVVPQQPEFPGGNAQLAQYLQQNLRYPETARAANLGGRVFIHFLINKQGGIERVEVLKGLSSELDAEAVRLVEQMPAWYPGKVAGQAVDCFYNLPINFSLR